MEQPATINARVRHQGRKRRGVQADDSRYVVVNNAKLTSQRKVFDAGAPAAQVPATDLFPFLDGYGLYAGQCTPQTSPRARSPTRTRTRARRSPPTPRSACPRSTSACSARTGARSFRSPRPSRTVFVKPADGCATTYPSQNIANTTTGGLVLAAQAGLPVRDLQALRPAHGLRGHHPRARRPAHGRRHRRLRHHQAHQHRRRGDGGQPHRRHHQQHERKRRSGAGGQPHLSGQPRSARQQRLDHHPAEQDRPVRVTARRRASDERGFTIIELMVAMSVGMVVLLAAFMLLDRSFTASGQIADRQEALQRGRQAMELITRQLRSQVCVVVPPATTFSPPVVDGQDNQRDLLRQPQREQPERDQANAHLQPRPAPARSRSR